MRFHFDATSSSMRLAFGGSCQVKPSRFPITVNVVAAYAPSYRASTGASPRRRLSSSPAASSLAISLSPLVKNACCVTSRRVPSV